MRNGCVHQKQRPCKRHLLSGGFPAHLPLGNCLYFRTLFFKPPQVSSHAQVRIVSPVSGVGATATTGQPATYTRDSLGSRFNNFSSQVVTRIPSNMLLAHKYWTFEVGKTKTETNGTHKYGWLVVIYKLDIFADLINPLLVSSHQAPYSSNRRCHDVKTQPGHPHLDVLRLGVFFSGIVLGNLYWHVTVGSQQALREGMNP